MIKTRASEKPASVLTVGLLFVGGATAALLIVWALFSFFSHTSSNSFTSFVSDPKHNLPHIPDENSGPDSPGINFYDDPKLSYTIGTPPLKNWDEKRRDWLKQHPSFAAGAEDRVLIITGSQDKPCKNPVGDHLLLRLFKNKVDYARRHNIDIFYNNVLLHPKMFFCWAKLPIVKAAMLAHPEVEWIWWVDSDAVFTDMDFKLQLSRYKAHNMVIHGWPFNMNDKKSWSSNSINAGVFLIRNCQWSMDFMDVWADMGPQSPNYEKWGEIQTTTFKDKSFPISDDQSGLFYLLLTEKEKWGSKIFVEYDFQVFWLQLVGKFDNITDKYMEIEKKVPGLRRRHAEKVSERYARVWEERVKNAGYELKSWRRPFITHFAGCQPCNGEHNPMYSGQSCFDSMQNALVFADNQVLRNYGFVHRDLGDPAAVDPVSFDYRA